MPARGGKNPARTIGPSGRKLAGFNVRRQGEVVGSVGLTPKMTTQAHPGTAPVHGIEKYTWALGLLLVVATVALYYPVSGHPFVNYDDNVYVTECFGCESASVCGFSVQHDKSQKANLVIGILRLRT